jgi:hypothetical protein
MHRGTLEIGRITRRMVSESSITRMETSMRVCGKETNAMAKEPTGETRQENCEESIQEIGSKIRSMVEAHSSIKTVIVTMATGCQGCHRVRVE